ncbi:uncharacterized protein N7506_007281 [Penicillium brevicompactum]|uniref:uncharacterized protein n=1 Tax=Penicillium brevicompactum TaxID=5074 RepID=UPI00254231C0|nr:uncharacterized protein N7506_007281 [Penicillium brevicompactum]KAJ5333498.1 hypothetical protein N7506_007281 [Penicillium brevicompactum]
MPSEVSDIKQFIEICRRKDASCTLRQNRYRRPPTGRYMLTVYFLAAGIKKNRKTQQTKFKVRCSTNLYTLVLKDSDKADKLKQSLPLVVDVSKGTKKSN